MRKIENRTMKRLEKPNIQNVMSDLSGVDEGQSPPSQDLDLKVLGTTCTSPVSSGVDLPNNLHKRYYQKQDHKT